MKNTLLIAALTLAVAPAMASKARLSALNNAKHLSDIQDVFNNPAKVTDHGDWLTAEFGPTTPGANNAEGGFSRSMGAAKYGFYLGHHDNQVATATAASPWKGLGARQTTYLIDENPLNLFYASKAADMAWGVGLNYSNSDKKSVKKKQSATGLTGGVAMGNWDAAIDLGLVNTYKDETAGVDFKGTSAIGLSGKYTMDTLTFDAEYGMNGGKEETNGTETKKYDNTGWGLGVVNSMKKDGTDFFYGARYEMYTLKEKTADTKAEASYMPVFAGIEADATSWMVLRASVQQNFLLGSEKINGGDADTIGNDTVVAAGAGLKFGKLNIDGTLKGGSGAAANGQLDGNNMLANASVTYLF